MLKRSLSFREAQKTGDLQLRRISAIASRCIVI